MNKPEHLSKAVGDQFSDKSVVEHYNLRPDYSDEVIQFLSSSLNTSEMTVLDIGTGTGEIAIPLSKLGHRVVGVDPSREMIKAANAKQSDVTFVQSYIEDFSSDQRFDLFIAANSIHWADWNKAFPVLKFASNNNARLAIVTGGDIVIEGLQNEIIELVKTYSTTKNFQPYCVVTMLEEAKYINNVSTTHLPACSVVQSLEDFIASFHARNGFSLDRMDPKLACEFDEKLMRLLLENGFTNQIHGEVTYKVTLADIV